MRLEAMRGGRNRSARRFGVGLAASALVVVLAACQPGTTQPFAGNGTSGTGGDAGPAVHAQLEAPGEVLAIPGGGFWVADSTACVIRKVDKAGVISTVAGTGTCGYTGFDGPALSTPIAPKTACTCAALGPNGSLFFLSGGSVPSETSIKILTTDGTIVDSGFFNSGVTGAISNAPDGTWFSMGSLPGSLGAIENYTNPATPILVYTIPADEPLESFAYLSPGKFAIAEYPSGAIDRLDTATGVRTPTGVSFSGPIPMLAGAPDGTIYATTATKVERIDPDNTVTVIAGNGTADPGTSAQVGTGTSLSLSPAGIALTPNNGLLISSGHVVYRLQDPAHAG
jgi:serine/threonine-protein kinase